MRKQSICFCLGVLLFPFVRVMADTDFRRFDNGAQVPDESYCDQPYVVETKDGNWLCVLTTGPGHESEPGQHIVATISRDKGKTWSGLIAIEPSEGPESSWGVPFVTPGGRVYVFYNYNGGPVPKRNGKPVVATLGGWYVYKYSDDNGKTWSERQRLPLTLAPVDLGNDWKGEFQMFWGIDKPKIIGDRMVFGFTRMGKYIHHLGEGWLFSSDNILSERDPAKIRWELYPSSQKGIRAEEFGSVQEEHNVVPLSGSSVFCMYRTQKGHPCHSYSRDGGRTWTTPVAATYAPGGRKIKTPMACPRVWRTADGKYLLWFHNTSSELKGTKAPWSGRNLGWISGGVEKDGVIHWSEPELVSYVTNKRKGASYPDLIEGKDVFYLFTTNKHDARIQHVSRSLVEELWRQPEIRSIAEEGLVLDVKDPVRGEKDMPRLPNLAEGGGFSVDIWIRLDSAESGQVILDSRDEEGRGLLLETVGDGALRVSLSDGATRSSWDSDPGLLGTGLWHHVVCNVDGGPKMISFIIDGKFNDGGDDVERPYGYGRFFPAEDERQVVVGPDLGDVSGGAVLAIAPSLKGRLGQLRLYNRYLRTSEAVGNYQTGKDSPRFKGAEE